MDEVTYILLVNLSIFYITASITGGFLVLFSEGSIEFHIVNLYALIFFIPFFLAFPPLFFLYKSSKFIYNICRIRKLHEFMLQKPEDAFKFKIKLEKLDE